MSQEENKTTENQLERGSGKAIWTAVAIAGVATAAFFITKKLIKGEKLMDADSLLKAADKAANQLDAILRSESSKAVS